MIFDLSLSVDCSPGGAESFCLKSHYFSFCWHITHEDFLRLIFRNSFYALLCRRSVSTTLLNFNSSTFISLANSHSFTSSETASRSRNRSFGCYEIHLTKMIFPLHLSDLRLHNCSFCRVCLSRFFALVL